MSYVQLGLPSDDRLEAGLANLLVGHGCRQMKVLSREKNAYTSTFSSEVVECLLDGEQSVSIFCKYMGADIKTPNGGDNETNAYSQILSTLPLTSAKYFGSWKLDDSSTCLAIQFFSDGQRLTHAPNLERVMELAARWLGTFHRLTARQTDWPVQIAPEHCRERMHRVKAIHADLWQQHKWFYQLFDRFDGVLQLLFESPQSVVHGEYYPKNILYFDGAVYPIDWETTAFGPGVCDFAMLIENWPDAIAARCKRAYLDALQSDVAPKKFDRIVLAAQAYVSIHWLGYPLWSPSDLRENVAEQGQARIQRLHDTGKRLQLWL